MKQKIGFALIMGVITTGIVSFTLMAIFKGFANNFLSAWLRAWLTAYIVAVPAILIIGPKVQKFVDRLFSEKIISTD
jgi:hypothetical protein